MTEPSPPPAEPAALRGTDRLLTVLLPADGCRLILVDASETCFEMEFRHLSGRIAAEVGAHAATAACLIGSDLKDDERLSIRLHCGGPIEGCLVEVDSALNIRGYTTRKVLADLDGERDAYPLAIGTEGRIFIVRSTADRVVYQGVTELAAGDVDSDLEQHLHVSQQVPSLLRVDSGYRRQLTHSVGLLLQAMPDHDPARFEVLRATLSAQADAARPFTRDLEALLDALLPRDVERMMLGSRPVRFRCRCSREKARNTLRGLGPPEGEARYPEITRVTCAFCNDVYEITVAELEAMAADPPAAPEPPAGPFAGLN